MDNTFIENENKDDGRIEGKNPVLEALKAEHPINRIYLEKDSKDATISKIYSKAREKGVLVIYTEKIKLDKMSVTRNHQGVIADAAPYKYYEVDDILKKAEDLNEPPFIIILDGITDENNFGSIIRSSECAGAHGIIISKRRSAVLSPTVSKVSAGAAEHMPVARVTNLTRTIEDLKKRGIWVAGSEISAKTIYTEYDFKSPVAIVVGSEGEGISRLVMDSCDVLLKIPMKGKINSLNAGVAAALLIFEAHKQRNN